MYATAIIFEQLQEAAMKAYAAGARASGPLETPSVYANRILKQMGMSSISAIPSCDFGSGVGTVACPAGEFENEYHFNKEFHPELAKVFGEQRLFNTERNSYLPASERTSNDKKPDWAIFEIPSLLKRNSAPKSFASQEICYATPPEELLDLVTFIFEGKIGTGNLTPTDLAALLTYLALLLKENHANPRGVLYNQREFIYVEYDHAIGDLSLIERSTWATAGCREFLQKKCVPPPAMQKLQRALLHGSFTPGRWLGRGRFGLVLEAAKGDVVYALKVVTDHFNFFKAEFEKLSIAHKKAGHLVVQPVPDSLVVGDGYAYYLMSDVGESSDGIYRRDVFKLICALHLKEMVHGDPRVQNIVKLGTAYKWVDMRQEFDMRFDSHSIEDDMRVVVKSSFHCTDDAIRKIDAIETHLQSYCQHVSEPNVETLYDCCKALDP